MNIETSNHPPYFSSSHPDIYQDSQQILIAKITLHVKKYTNQKVLCINTIPFITELYNNKVRKNLKTLREIFLGRTW